MLESPSESDPRVSMNEEPYNGEIVYQTYAVKKGVE